MLHQHSVGVTTMEEIEDALGYMKKKATGTDRININLIKYDGVPFHKTAIDALSKQAVSYTHLYKRAKK